ncbi:Uncharacterised protein [BD1-7 clade bacterium]|uniref:Uncharacterized protein n=1 Tax=BD1-7 clade bacterium TaxID=2029982 RepID=A0A5S9QRC5_9GAMM|nr:Uncharacterised protein [BD1-7 clade bacterium]
MDIVIVVLEGLILVGIACIFLFRKYLLSYSSEKAKNLATKEDIGEITNSIEGVKLDYAHKLEATKAELSSQINTHGFRYEKEFEVLEMLADSLVDLRNAALNLRPVFEFVDKSKSKDEIKIEKLVEFDKARRDLFFIREKKRPFYPDSIYQAVLKIDELARSESVEYEYRDPYDGGRDSDYWKKAEENQSSIIEATNLAMDEIRERVSKWEALSR